LESTAIYRLMLADIQFLSTVLIQSKW